MAWPPGQVDQWVTGIPVQLRQQVADMRHGENFAKAYRRIRLTRAMGHNPQAANCIFIRPEEGDYIETRQVCDRCWEIAKRWGV